MGLIKVTPIFELSQISTVISVDSGYLNTIDEKCLLLRPITLIAKAEPSEVFEYYLFCRGRVFWFYLFVLHVNTI